MRYVRAENVNDMMNTFSALVHKNNFHCQFVILKVCSSLMELLPNYICLDLTKALDSFFNPSHTIQ